jgi:hypothetical protein
MTDYGPFLLSPVCHPSGMLRFAETGATISAVVETKLPEDLAAESSFWSSMGNWAKKEKQKHDESEKARFSNKEKIAEADLAILLQIASRDNPDWPRKFGARSALRADIACFCSIRINYVGPGIVAGTDGLRSRRATCR